MEIAKEDLLHIRHLIANKYKTEMTPAELLELLNEFRKVEVVDKPGLVTELKELRNDE